MDICMIFVSLDDLTFNQRLLFVIKAYF